MYKNTAIVVFLLFLSLSLSVNVFGADVILNEYNAVVGSRFLGDGKGSDSYFGKVRGNGGDWFELVVITDHLDMTGWQLEIYDDGALEPLTLNLTDHAIWSDLRSGTIITVSEDVPSDISYDPAGGDWWINVQAEDNADGLYITASNFPVTKDDWQLIIKDDVSAVVFDRAGEGVSPIGGVSDTEIFRLEADPDASIDPNSPDYDDAKSSSTFGSPNNWGGQNLLALKCAGSSAPGSTSILLTSPTASQIIQGGTEFDITWVSTGVIEFIQIELSIDGETTWMKIGPPNVADTGTFTWSVPNIDSTESSLRITNMCDTTAVSVSVSYFTIEKCQLEGDVTGNCFVDLEDFLIMATQWLQ